MFFKKTSSLLLIGTKNSNKALLKRCLIRGEYSVEETEDKKHFIDLKSQKKFLTVTRRRQENFPVLKLLDAEQYTVQFCDRKTSIIKLIDGPVYENDENNLIEVIHSCILLNLNSYNGVIVAFTADKVSQCMDVLKVLSDKFRCDLTRIFLFIIFEKELLIANEFQKDFKELENMFRERLLRFQIEDNINEIDKFFTLLEVTHSSYKTNLFTKNNENLVLYSQIEEILKYTSILLEIVMTEQAMPHNANQILQHVEQLVYDINANRGSSQRLQMDTSVLQDVTHICECLKNIYLVSEPMVRCKKLLIASLKDSYRNVHDCFVRSIIKDKDILLDSNEDIRLLDSICDIVV